MIDIVRLGERIKYFRKREGLTQNELADYLGVSFQAVSNWERGVAPPDIDNLEMLARRFNILIDALLKHGSENCMIGIDGGGTKTEFVVFDCDGNVRKKVVCSGSNPNDVGIKESIDVLKKGIDLCLMDFPEIKYIFCGVAGAGAGKNKKDMKEALCDIYKNVDISIDTDVFNIISLDKNNSIYLICGTGSVVMVNTSSGIKRIGGWGYLFDEKGSAYDIGKDAVKASLAYMDGIGEYTVLKEKIEKILGGNLWENIKTVYEKGKPFIASFAPLVFEAGKNGDKIANEIIDENCKRLAVLINAALKYSSSCRVTVGGGLIGAYSDEMTKNLAKYTDAVFVIPDLPPVYGACVTCVDMFGLDVPANFKANFKKTYYNEQAE